MSFDTNQERSKELQMHWVVYPFRKQQEKKLPYLERQSCWSSTWQQCQCPHVRSNTAQRGILWYQKLGGTCSRVGQKECQEKAIWDHTKEESVTWGYKMDMYCGVQEWSFCPAWERERALWNSSRNGSDESFCTVCLLAKTRDRVGSQGQKLYNVSVTA